MMQAPSPPGLAPEPGGPPPCLLVARRSGGLKGTIEVPGDKSMSHRALILGALAEGQTRIGGLLESSDVLATLGAVQAFGAIIERNWSGDWLVTGGRWHSPDLIIDCGNSGTGARLLLGAAARFPLRAVFTGDESLRSRPMQRVVEPLREMGALTDGSFFLPITIRGGALRGISYSNPIASAQVKSAILLAGLGTSEPVEVREKIASRDHTEEMLKAFGVDVDVSEDRSGYRVRLGARRKLEAASIEIPGDPSSAAFPIVAALITPGSEISVTNLLSSRTREGLLATLLEMGATLEIRRRQSEAGLSVMDVTARHSRLKGVRIPANRAPSMIDEYPILGIAAAFAHGETVMEGLGELRAKESDRLSAIHAGLAACKVDAKVEGDTLKVRGTGEALRGGATIESHGDHRIAMAFLVAGLAAQDEIRVDRAEMIATSFPGFTELMNGLGASIEPVGHDRGRRAQA